MNDAKRPLVVEVAEMVEDAAVRLPVRFSFVPVAEVNVRLVMLPLVEFTLVTVPLASVNVPAT